MGQFEAIIGGGLMVTSVLQDPTGPWGCKIQMGIINFIAVKLKDCQSQRLAKDCMPCRLVLQRLRAVFQTGRNVSKRKVVLEASENP